VWKPETATASSNGNAPPAGPGLDLEHVCGPRAPSAGVATAIGCAWGASQRFPPHQTGGCLLAPPRIITRVRASSSVSWRRGLSGSRPAARDLEVAGERQGCRRRALVRTSSDGPTFIDGFARVVRSEGLAGGRWHPGVGLDAGGPRSRGSKHVTAAGRRRGAGPPRSRTPRLSGTQTVAFSALEKRCGGDACPWTTGSSRAAPLRALARPVLHRARGCATFAAAHASCASRASLEDRRGSSLGPGPRPPRRSRIAFRALRRLESKDPETPMFVFKRPPSSARVRWGARSRR